MMIMEKSAVVVVAMELLQVIVGGLLLYRGLVHMVIALLLCQKLVDMVSGLQLYQIVVEVVNSL